MAHAPYTKATLARRRLISQLRASEMPRAAEVEAVLEGCTPTASCRSAACPVCGLAFQQAAVSVVEQFIRVPARPIRNRATALTIVPASGCVPPDELSVEDFARVRAEITAALAALDLPPTLVGLEASFNEDTTGKFEDHWSVHGHGLQLGWLSGEQKKALRGAFPRSRLVERPVKCEPLDRRIEGQSYPFKPERVRRVTQLNTDDADRKPFRESKRRGLRPWQAVSLAIVEHRFGFSGRLLTYGVNDEAVRQHLEGLGWARDGP